MKKLTLLICGLSLAVLAASKSPKSDAALLAGSWIGEEIGRNTNGTALLVVEGSTMEFRGVDAREWYKATFSLQEDTQPKQLVAVVTECSSPKYVGKTAYSIYQIQDGTFTLTGNRPGNPEVPTSFDAPGARKFVFQRKQS